MTSSIKHSVTVVFLEGSAVKSGLKESSSVRNRNNLFRSGVDFSELSSLLRYLMFVPPGCLYNIFWLICKAFNELQVICFKQLLPKS